MLTAGTRVMSTESSSRNGWVSLEVNTQVFVRRNNRERFCATTTVSTNQRAKNEWSVADFNIIAPTVCTRLQVERDKGDFNASSTVDNPQITCAVRVECGKSCTAKVSLGSFQHLKCGSYSIGASNEITFWNKSDIICYLHRCKGILARKGVSPSLYHTDGMLVALF